jgi:hypothetical protein
MEVIEKSQLETLMNKPTTLLDYKPPYIHNAFIATSTTTDYLAVEKK